MNTFTLNLQDIISSPFRFYDALFETDEEKAADEANKNFKEVIDNEVDNRVAKDLKEATDKIKDEE